jgi:threonine dehydrogenase-like Zn-dependent dehydrogenase
VLGSFAEPLACVLRGAERVAPGEVLVLGGGFVGQLFAAVLRRRGDTVFVRDPDPARNGPEPPGSVVSVVVCARGAGADALSAVEPGGSVLLFADGGALDSGEIYRREIAVTGSRSATRRHTEEAVALLRELDLPEPLVLPLERFEEGLAAYRSREALKVVFRP